MPIRLTGSQNVRASSDTQPGGLYVASFQLWIRVDQVGGPVGTFFGKGSATPFGIYRESASGSNQNFSLRWVTTARADLSVLTLARGIPYHVAATIDHGVIKFYLNGQVAYSATRADAALTSAFNTAWQLGVTNAGTGGEVLVDDACFWSNYALSAAEVKALRDRDSSPLDISPSGHLLYWTADGAAGATVAASDAGVQTIAAGGKDASAVGGSPVYSGESLSYVAPVRVRSAFVAPSRKSLVFYFETLAGADATITGIASHPTIRINGGPEASLSSPGGFYARNYALYPLPSTVGTGDGLTYSAPEGWVTSALGIIGASEDADAGTESRDILPEFTTEPKTMDLGFNVEAVTNYDSGPTFANQVRQTEPRYNSFISSPVGLVLTDDDEVASLSGGTMAVTLWGTANSGFGSPDKGYNSLNTGRLRLTWDGPCSVTLASSDGARGSVSLVSEVITGGAGNERIYQFTLNSNVWQPNLAYRVAPGAGATNIRVTDYDVPSGWTSKFHPILLERLEGARVLRFMDAGKTNNSNAATASDLASASRRSAAGTAARKTNSVVRIGPYTASPAGYFNSLGGRVSYTVTTAAPHELVTGQIVTFRGLSAPLACTDGTSYSLNGTVCTVRVLSPTTFAAWRYVGAEKVVVDQALTGFVDRDLGNTMSIEDMADLCAAVGADAWGCVPHALDDAGVAAWADRWAARLPSGLRLRVEYSNECWNQSLNFMQAFYCNERGTLEGLTGRQWYAKRSGEVHAIVRARFVAAGRPATDVIRFFGAQVSSVGNNTPVLDYCLSNGIPVDEMGGAPYYALGPYQNPALYEAIDADQLMDLADLGMVDYARSSVVGNRTALRARFPSAEFICYEGGLEAYQPLTLSYSLGGVQAGARSRAGSRHPRARYHVRAYCQNLQDYGVPTFCYYSLRILPVNYESLVRGAIWGAHNSGRNMRAARGDGSDGYFDNRTGYDALNQIVSPVALGIQDWIGLLSGEVPVDPEDPEEPEESSGGDPGGEGGSSGGDGGGDSSSGPDPVEGSSGGDGPEESSDPDPGDPGEEGSGGDGEVYGFDEPCITPEELLRYVDRRYVAQLLRDDGYEEDADALLGGDHEVLTELILRACADLEAAATRGGLYSTEDLEELFDSGGAGAAFLRGLVSDMVVEGLDRRRAFRDGTPLPAAARAAAILRDLTVGRSVLSFAGSQRSGRPVQRYLTPGELAQVALKTLDNRFWGDRRIRRP